MNWNEAVGSKLLGIKQSDSLREQGNPNRNGRPNGRNPAWEMAPREGLYELSGTIS